MDRKNNKTRKQIEENLYKALLEDAEMSYALYKYELEEHIDYWKEGLHRDKNEFLFVVTENNGDVAMLMITKKDKLLINEDARDQLKLFWNKNDVYRKNIEYLLPSIATELDNGELSVNGVKFA